MNEELFTEGLARLFPAGADVLTGIGDDCAVLDFGLDRLILAAADQVVERVHFTPETPPASVARKLLKRNISDIAAMGGLPTHALATIARFPLDPQWLDAFNRGLAECAAEYGISVIGGDTSRLPASGCAASLTILGKVEREKLCLRSNAREGDFLYATGFFGNSFGSGHHIDFTPRLPEARFLAGTYTSAMMDVSDGPGKDAARFAAASKLAAELDAGSLPLRKGATPDGALSDGEDYELIFAVRPERAVKLEKEWPFAAVPLTRIGRFPARTDRNRNIRTNEHTGFDHFQ